MNISGSGIDMPDMIISGSGSDMPGMNISGSGSDMSGMNISGSGSDLPAMNISDFDSGLYHNVNSGDDVNHHDNNGDENRGPMMLAPCSSQEVCLYYAISSNVRC